MTTVTRVHAEYPPGGWRADRNLATVPDRSPPARMPPPLDPPMLPFALGGIGIWAVIGVGVLVAGGPVGWRWTCLAGVLLGLAALPVMVVHDRRRHRRRRPGPDGQVTSSTSLSS